MAVKMHSVGVKLQYDADGSGSYTDATDIISITPPKGKADRSDTTHLESTAAWREAIPGFIEAGQLGFMGYVHKTQWAVFYTTLFVGRASYYYRIQAPVLSGESTGSKIDMYGFIGEIGLEDIQDEAIKFSATVELSGAMTFTAGS